MRVDERMGLRERLSRRLSLDSLCFGGDGRMDGDGIGRLWW
jgi:hypothetical protein